MQQLGFKPHFDSLSSCTILVKRIVLVIASCLAFVSCGQLAMDDVSNVPEFSGAIGKKFRTKDDLLAIGVTKDANYKKMADHITLVPIPGFSGPEVVTKARVSKGFVFQVVGVLKAASVASKRVIYIVEDVNTRKFKGTPIGITLTGQISDRNLGLDESIYEKM